MYSNLEVIQNFIIHVEEFKNTRYDKEKMRAVLFPKEINSIFGIIPVSNFIIPSTEALEELITVLRKKKIIGRSYIRDRQTIYIVKRWR